MIQKQFIERRNRQNKTLTIFVGTVRFETFEDVTGDWWWHTKSMANGKKTATSGESFDSRLKAERAMRGYIKATR